MNPAGQEILHHLKTVECLRAERMANQDLARKVHALKAYQAARFSRTYADLLQDPRYRGAARFFLDELYGPQEFAARDAQFARVVPGLVRMFPEELVQTVAALGTLHSLSESLDSEMASHLASAGVDAITYVRLWQVVGQPKLRQQQIQLILQIGQALDRYTRNRVLRTALRMMRRPAQAAGLGDLQRFLETGFDTFGAMGGASEFLGIVRAREQALADALFDTRASASVTEASSSVSRIDATPLGQLP